MGNGTEKLTHEKILEDAVYAAAPWMSRDEVKEFVKQPRPTTDSQEEEKKDMNKELLTDAVKVVNNFVTRMLKKKKASLDGVVVPQITSLRTFRQGNYTVVLVNDEFIGVSKRNKSDKFNQNTGLRKALYRAVRRLVLTSQR